MYKRYRTAGLVLGAIFLASVGMNGMDAQASGLGDSLNTGVASNFSQAADTEELTQGLFRAFVQNQRAVNILFSGSRQGVFANSIEQGLRKRVAELDPTFTADPRRGIVLSFCVQGCFYAFTNNSGRMDEAKLVALLAEIAKAAQKIEL